MLNNKTFNIGSRQKKNVATRAGERLIVATVATLYFLALCFAYTGYLAQYEYLGYLQGNPSTLELFLCYLLIVAPIVFFRLEISTFHGFVFWQLYFFSYVPSSLFSVMQGRSANVMLLPLALSLSMLLISFMPQVKAVKIALHINIKAFWTAFAFLYVTCVAYAVYVFGSSLSIVAFSELYIQRKIGGDVSVGTYGGYAIGALSGAFNPFLVAFGLVHRKWIAIVLGCAGQIFVFATLAAKAAVVWIPITVIFYAILFRKERVNGLALLATTITLGFVIPLGLIEIIGQNKTELLDEFASLVLMRTYTLPGLFTGIYDDFFARNDFTFYSHINVVGLILKYPYPLSIGEVIGEDMGLFMNANANFFATDGIAAAGYGGVVFIGIVAGIVLRVIDSICTAPARRLLCIASVPFVISLTNASLFATLLTGGGILLVIMCCILPHTDVASHQQRSR